MSRPKLEVAEIFRAHGPAYRRDHAGHIHLPQLKVMSAIENCRTAAPGGHVAACTKCSHQPIADTFCRNRHGPSCWKHASGVTVLEARLRRDRAGSTPQA